MSFAIRVLEIDHHRVTPTLLKQIPFGNYLDVSTAKPCGTLIAHFLRHAKECPEHEHLHVLWLNGEKITQDVLADGEADPRYKKAEDLSIRHELLLSDLYAFSVAYQSVAAQSEISLQVAPKGSTYAEVAITPHTEETKQQIWQSIESCPSGVSWSDDAIYEIDQVVRLREELTAFGRIFTEQFPIGSATRQELLRLADTYLSDKTRNWTDNFFMFDHQEGKMTVRAYALDWNESTDESEMRAVRQAEEEIAPAREAYWVVRRQFEVAMKMAEVRRKIMSLAKEQHIADPWRSDTILAAFAAEQQRWMAFSASWSDAYHHAQNAEQIFIL